MRTMNIDRAAAHFSVTRRTIYNWIAAGRLTRIYTPYGPLIVIAKG